MERIGDSPGWTTAEWWLERSAQRQGIGTSGGTRLIGVPICPDLLDHAALGAADNLRGCVVRSFFWLLRLWPTPR